MESPLFNSQYSKQRGMASRGERGLTLIETLVAVTILTVAVVAPMSLTMQSLSASYYARDQIIASNLAQEAIESVRAVRDGNILKLALDPSATCDDDAMHLLCGILIDTDFVIDARETPPTITPCSGACPLLRTDDNLYGYGGAGWYDTDFRRTVRASFVAGNENPQDEIVVTVTVERVGGLRPPPAVTITENLYRWVEDGIGS